jgi:hypothetical protein
VRAEDATRTHFGSQLTLAVDHQLIRRRAVAEAIVNELTGNIHTKWTTRKVALAANDRSIFESNASIYSSHAAREFPSRRSTCNHTIHALYDALDLNNGPRAKKISAALVPNTVCAPHVQYIIVRSKKGRRPLHAP